MHTSIGVSERNFVYIQLRRSRVFVQVRSLRAGQARSLIVSRKLDAARPYVICAKAGADSYCYLLIEDVEQCLSAYFRLLFELFPIALIVELSRSVRLQGLPDCPDCRAFPIGGLSQLAKLDCFPDSPDCKAFPIGRLFRLVRLEGFPDWPDWKAFPICPIGRLSRLARLECFPDWSDWKASPIGPIGMFS